MADKKTKIMEGSNILGEARKYSFLLMDATTGTRLFHQYISLIVQALPILGKLFAGGEEKPAADMKQISEIVTLLPSILTWDRVVELAREMLAGHTANIDDIIYTADETGFHEGVTGDPLEIYTAIFYAITANYPKYVDPFLAAMEEAEKEAEKDSSPSTEAKSPLPDSITV